MDVHQVLLFDTRYDHAHQILDRVAQLLDDNLLSCTLTKELTPFTAANLRQGHRLVESGHMIGKVAMSGWK